MLVYPFYPIVMFIRLAKFFYALCHYYFRYGTVPYYDVAAATSVSFLLEIFQWFHFGGSLLLISLLSKYETFMSQFLVPIVSTFWLDFDHGPCRRARRASSALESGLIYCYLTNYMVLNQYCLYASWWFLNNSSAWATAFANACYWDGYTFLVRPSELLEPYIKHWPPDGVILRLLALLAIVSFFGFLIYEEYKRFLLSLTRSDVARIASCASETVRKKCYRRWSRLRYRHLISVLTSFALSSESTQAILASISFDTDTILAVLDNSATAHIWSRLEDFVPGSLHYFDDSDNIGVMTIGDVESRPVGIGLVPISIKDQDGNIRSIELVETLYFPNSQVNIISVTKLAEQFDDPDGTWIKTCWRTSTFTWDHEKYSVTFSHPSSNLPILPICMGFAKGHSFCSLFEGTSCTYPSHPVSAWTALPDKTDYCYFASGETSVSEEARPISVGDHLLLKKDGMQTKVDVMEITKDTETDVNYFKVLLDSGNHLSVTEEFLFETDDHDVAQIPVTSSQLKQYVQGLDEETIEALLSPPLNSKLHTEFMAWHSRLGHLSFTKMFSMCEHGQLPRRFLNLRSQKLICPSCVFGQCRRRPWRTKGKPGSLRNDKASKAGDRVSIDHLISAQPGLVPRMDGRHTKDRIVGACVFVDDATGYKYTHLQTSIDGEQSVAAKQAFEDHMNQMNVSIKAYHADNGIFAEREFREEVSSSNQSITYCGVGAHHQNGIAEKAIGDLTRGSRTSLLYAQRRWPEAVGSILWPFAWKDFERRYNLFSLDSNGLSPLNKVTGSDLQPDLSREHPFGCPVFVLDSRLQSGGIKIPKWDPRARVGIYLGHSPCHAGSVALVLNPKSLRVSPQYHVIFDDEFTTVPYMRSGEVPPHWSELVAKSAELATDEDFDLATTWANDYIAGRVTRLNEEDVSGRASSEIVLNQTRQVDFESSNFEEEGKSSVSEEAPNQANTEDIVVNPLLFPTLPDLDSMTLRRSPRIHAKQQKKSALTIFAVFHSVSNAFTTVKKERPSYVFQKVILHSHNVNKHFDGTLNYIHHAVLMAAEDNDTYTLKDMFKQEDKAEFIAAMMKEVEDHEKRNHWTVMPRDEMPKGAKTILAIWSFKRKRFPDGRVLKHKARLCAHGGMQTWGENYWETYSPVVNWLSVRTLLVISIIHDLETRSIDFVLAFPQAELDVDVFMELPFGFEIDQGKRYVLKLNKNLYGLKQAAYNWFEMLKNGLEARGYEQQSASDSCVFIGSDSIILCYVDDCIIFQRKGSKAADRLIDSLKRGHENFDFTDDGDLKRYLGVDVVSLPGGGFHLKQTHLIQRFLSVIGFDENVNDRPTPAVKPLLHKDLDGLERKTSWNYRQAVGMLTYLQGTSRPDISMAVHQVARFSILPKLSHERAINRIGKYLLGTADKGIIYKPDKSKGLECYVDADFAGGWNQADATNADAVLSRTGYVIMYAGCPLLWCSKLQTEIALSTTEAEYIALSQSLREVIPLMTLLKEIDGVFPIGIQKPKIHCKVWEDNNSCISLAKGQKFSPRTKHIAIKYHHFRSFVKDKTIEIFPIDTREQTADIFTKPLDEALFKYLRYKLMGW